MSTPHRLDPDYKRREEVSGHMKSAKTEALRHFLDKDNPLKGKRVAGT